MQFSSKIQKRILYEILIQFLNQFIIFAAVLVCRICFISGWNHCQWTMCAHVSGIWSISERWLCTKFWGKAHFSLKLYYFVCKTNEIFMYARIIYCVALCSRTPLCWWYCRWQWNISMIMAWWTSRPWTIWRVRKICGATFFSLTPFSHWKSGYVHRTYMTYTVNTHTQSNTQTLAMQMQNSNNWIYRTFVLHWNCSAWFGRGLCRWRFSFSLWPASFCSYCETIHVTALWFAARL